MHPYHYGHPGYHWYHFHHRGPHRFIWFLIGAGVATWWIKHKEEHQRLGYEGGHCGPWGLWGHDSQRPAIQPAQLQSVDQTQGNVSQQPQQIHPGPWGWRHDNRMNCPSQQAAPATPVPVISSPNTTVVEVREEKMQVPAQVANVGQQAGDKLVELSEATLDSVLTTVEVLKVKLAEHRAERERSRGDKSGSSSPRLV